MVFYKSGVQVSIEKATSLIHSESVSSLSLYLQEMDVNRMSDEVETEALAKDSFKYAKNATYCAGTIDIS